MQKKLFLLSTLTIATLCFSTGCASIVSDSKYNVVIKSEPAGADFVIKNKSGETIHNGTTPETVSLKAGDGYFSSASYKVEMTKEGYRKSVAPIESGFDGWYIGNIVFGGLIGFLIVDPITGAMWTLPTGVNVNLSAE